MISTWKLVSHSYSENFRSIFVLEIPSADTPETARQRFPQTEQRSCGTTCHNRPRKLIPALIILRINTSIAKRLTSVLSILIFARQWTQQTDLQASLQPLRYLTRSLAIPITRLVSATDPAHRSEQSSVTCTAKWPPSWSISSLGIRNRTIKRCRRSSNSRVRRLGHPRFSATTRAKSLFLNWGRKSCSRCKGLETLRRSLIQLTTSTSHRFGAPRLR